MFYTWSKLLFYSCFILLSLYAISSMFRFVNKEYDKVKIKELTENRSKPPKLIKK